MFRFIVSLILVLGLAQSTPQPTVSLPNEGIIAFSRLDGNIYLFDAAHKQETQVTHFNNEQQPPDMQYGSVPTFSPDGKQIAFALGYKTGDFGCGAIYIMDVTGDHIRLLNEKAVTSLPMSWSPNGKSILYSKGCSFSGEIANVDVSTGEISDIHSAGLIDAQYPVWSPDGKQIAYITWYIDHDDGDLAIADMTSDAPSLIIDDTYNNFSPSWSPDGKQIVFFGGDETTGNLYIVDVETQKVRQLTHDTNVLNTEPRWSPDGKWIAFYSGNYYGGDMYIIDTEGHNRSLLVKNIQNLSWQPRSS